jgi:hypothetical protein
MRLLTNALFIGLILLCNQLFSQTLVEWTHNYGGTDGEDACNFIPYKNGYVLLSTTESDDIDCTGNHGGYDINVIRVDSIGNVLWTKCYGGTNDEWPSRILRLHNNNLAIVGFSYSNNGDFITGSLDGDAFVLLIDSLGQIVNLRSYGGIYGDDLNDIIEDTTGNLIACGITSSTNVANTVGYSDVYLIKIDSSLNIIWEKTYGGTGYDEGFMLKISNDSKIVILGHTLSHDGHISGLHGSMMDILLIESDLAGTFVVSKCFGGTLPETVEDFIFSRHNTVLFVGGTFSNDGDVIGNATSTNLEGWIVSLDSNYNIIGQRSVGGLEEDISIKIVTGLNCYYVLNFNVNDNSSSNCTYALGNAVLYEMDSSLNLTEFGCYGGNGDDFAKDLIVLNDSNFVMYGFSSSQSSYYIYGNYGFVDLLLFKININQVTSLNNLESLNNALYFDGNAIKSKFPLNEYARVYIYNADGALVYSTLNYYGTPEIYNSATCLRGLYICRVVTAHYNLSVKFVI